MAFITTLASPALLPFSIALGLLLALLVLELAMSMIGGSLLGGEAGVEFDADAEFDAEIVAGHGDLMDAPGASGADQVADSSGFLSWLGLGKAPFGIWLAGVLTVFGVSGYVVQTVTKGVLGVYLPVTFAIAVALPIGILIGARFAQGIGRAVPRNETTAISSRSYGGRRGVVTVGTAARGRPAQVRFRDGHGNWHHAMVEPLHDHQEFGQGAEIAILRLKDGSLRAIGLED